MELLETKGTGLLASLEKERRAAAVCAHDRWTARLASAPQDKTPNEMIPPVLAAKTAYSIGETEPAPDCNKPAPLPRQLSLF